MPTAARFGRTAQPDSRALTPLSSPLLSLLYVGLSPSGVHCYLPLRSTVLFVHFTAVFHNPLCQISSCRQLPLSGELNPLATPIDDSTVPHLPPLPPVLQDPPLTAIEHRSTAVVD
jgi:hypothetical protein